MDEPSIESPGCAGCAVIELSHDELAERGIARVRVADLDLPSGALVACDPLQQWTRPAFARRVAPGRYPVTLYVRDRPGIAMVRFARGPVAHWELALLPGQDRASLEAGKTFGFAVGAGLAAFLDAASALLIDHRIAALAAHAGEYGVDYYEDVLAAELAPGRTGRYEWANHRPVADDTGNVVVFSAGRGGGCYPSWWGLGRNGEPVVLVTDFGLFDDSD